MEVHDAEDDGVKGVVANHVQNDDVEEVVETFDAQLYKPKA